MTLFILGIVFAQNTPIESLQRDKTVPTNECPESDTKQSDGEGAIMLELWRMQRNPSVPSLPDPLWPAVETPDRIVRIGQI